MEKSIYIYIYIYIYIWKKRATGEEKEGLSHRLRCCDISHSTSMDALFNLFPFKSQPFSPNLLIFFFLIP